MRLNIGCGRKPLAGYVNCDLQPLPGVDLVADAGAIPVDPGTVEEIFAQHVIEHIAADRWPLVLEHWHRLLIPGGRVIVECPDLRRVCEYYVCDFGGMRAWWHHCIYGDPDEGGRHLRGFVLEQLVADFKAAGFAIFSARQWHDYAEPKLWYNLRVEAVKP